MRGFIDVFVALTVAWIVAVGVSLLLLNSARKDAERVNEHQAHEIAVLLCSHHWQANGVVTHERPAAFRNCMAAFDHTGRVP